MNERPSFYPKHLAKQYVSTSRCSIRSKSESKSRETSPVKDAKMSNRREIFAPKMTSSTINLPARKNNLNEENISRNENRPQSKVLSGFPESFVDGMRTIFSLMDTKNEDKVKFEDIVTWWSTNEGDQNLPEGVVASLSKVATTEGYLTFERFCAGIKIAILRQEAAERKKRELNNNYEQSNSTTADASCPVITASQSSTACSSSATSSSLYQSSTGGSNMSQGTTGYSNMSQSSTGCSSMSTASAVTTDNSVFEEEPAPRPVSYQSPISPIQRKNKFGNNHFANSPLSRTSSLPSLPGALRAVDIPDQEAETASKRDERYNTPSPVPSEPWGGKAFQQEEEERRKILEGPPKPPRDPNRLSGIFYRGSTNSLPASSQTGQYPNISSYIHVNPTEQPIQFIWKSPPPEMRIPSLVHQQHQQLQQQHQLQQQQQQQHQLQQQQHIQQQQHYQIQQQQHHHLQQQQHIQHLQQHHPQQHQQQHFSIVVDENTQRTNEVQDIVVLRKPGSFRGVHSRNVRRHPSGSDTVSLKCTKMLEEEKMVLEEGLSVLERAQAIYRERLQLVELNLAQGPQRHLETVPVQLEAAQERVMFELKNIRDLNQRLGGIMKSAKPPNQQDRPRAPSQTRCHPEAQDQTSQDPNCDRRILRLQEQNRMLTDEVGRKSQAIFELEQEKRSLIRQLFQQTSTLCGSTDTIKNQNSKPNDHQQQPTAFNQNHFKKLDNEIKKLCIQ